MVDQAPLLWTFALLLLFGCATWLAVRSVRWAKKGTKGGAMLVAIAFPNPEQPPPQQQVEEETRRKKDTESGSPPSGADRSQTAAPSSDIAQSTWKDQR
jgi:hypothetical protein